MLRLRISDAARTDVINQLAWIHEQFGEAARLRYEALIVAALRDVATKPERPGSIARPELGVDVRSWHLRLSRDRAATGAVWSAGHVTSWSIALSLPVLWWVGFCTTPWNWRGTWTPIRPGSSHQRTVARRSVAAARGSALRLPAESG